MFPDGKNGVNQGQRQSHRAFRSGGSVDGGYEILLCETSVLHVKKMSTKDGVGD